MNKPDDIVTIFADHLTLEKPEGQAVLIERGLDQGECEMWTVRFVEDQNEHEYTRLIKKL